MVRLTPSLVPSVSSLTCSSIGVFSDRNVPALAALPIEKLVVTNTIPQSENIPLAQGKLVAISIAPIIAESIRRTHNGESISLLFGEWAERAAMYS